MADTPEPEDPVDLASADSFPASDPPSWTRTTAGAAPVTDREKAAESLNARIAHHWWIFALRGALALLFSFLAIVWPLATVFALVLLFAAYCLVDAIAAAILAVRGGGQGGRWGMLALHAMLGLAAAAISLFFPGLTLMIFAMLIATWALASGILTIIAAIRLRHDHGRWWMIAGGAAAVLIGIAIFLMPPLGLFALVWFVSLNALLFGVAMLMLAFRLRSRLHDMHLAHHAVS